MNKVYKKELFDEDTNIITFLEDDGIDAYNGGGSTNLNQPGKIKKISGKQYKLIVDENNEFLTCSAETFITTLKNVEKKFEYTLFG